MDQSGQSLSLGFGNWKMRAQGPVIVLIVVMVILAGSMSYIIVEASNQRSEEHARLEKIESRIVEEIQILSFIMTKPQAERPNLIVPKGLRGRLR